VWWNWDFSILIHPSHVFVDLRRIEGYSQKGYFKQARNLVTFCCLFKAISGLAVSYRKMQL